MSDNSDWFAEQFAQHLVRMRSIARRMLGNATDADDAVQLAWIKAARADTDSVENMGG